MNIRIERINYKHAEFYSDSFIAPAMTLPTITELVATIDSENISIKVEVSLHPDDVVMNGHTPDHEETIRKVMRNIVK